MADEAVIQAFHDVAMVLAQGPANRDEGEEILLRAILGSRPETPDARSQLTILSERAQHELQTTTILLQRYPDARFAEISVEINQCLMVVSLASVALMFYGGFYDGPIDYDLRLSEIRRYKDRPQELMDNWNRCVKHHRAKLVRTGNEQILNLLREQLARPEVRAMWLHKRLVDLVFADLPSG